MSANIISSREEGTIQVKIREDKYGLELAITRNGHQWTAIPVDSKILAMISSAILSYFFKREKKKEKKDEKNSSD